MYNKPIIMNIYGIEIEYDIDDNEIVFSKDNIILEEMTIEIFPSASGIDGDYEITFMNGNEEVACIDFTGSFEDDINAIKGKLIEIARKISKNQ